MLLQKLHVALVKTLEVERRFEPYFRGPLNYLLREPAAALIQYLINARRPNEHLALAEEKIYPWEEQCLDDIIRLMSEQMRGTSRRASLSAAATPKPMVWCAPQLLCGMMFPSVCGTGFSPGTAATRPGSAFPALARMCPRIFRMWVLAAWPSS